MNGDTPVVEPWVLLLQILNGVRRVEDYEVVAGAPEVIVAHLDDGSHWLLSAARWTEN